PRDLRHVMSFYSSPGFCDELLYLYYTRDVLRTAPNLDLDECLVVEFYSLNDAIEMARRGEILDAKTTAALFWLAHRKMGF
ncbi:MAG TPA: NUDIX hydrolase, partial [Acidobacteriota bacterium]|nr:NUDIX hydrolase [Acidobacteriota bacterium]